MMSLNVTSVVHRIGLRILHFGLDFTTELSHGALPVAVRHNLRLCAVFFAFIGSGPSAVAETLWGKVLDPQQHVIQGAQVSLVCPVQTEATRTDEEGAFHFNRPEFSDNCKIQVFQPGFAMLEAVIGRKRRLILDLQLAKVAQTVVVKGDALSHQSLTSAVLSAGDLKKISSDSKALVQYAKQLAGVSDESDHLYVDGMPADQLPPAGTIANITVNDDPYSAEFSDGDYARVEILTTRAERKFHFNTGGLSLGPHERDSLRPALSSSTRSANFGLMAPVPYVPIELTGDIYFMSQRSGVPIEAVVPTLQGVSLNRSDSAPTRRVSGNFRFGADFSQGETLNVNMALNLLTLQETNVYVGGITLPEAGANLASNIGELRTTFRKSGVHFSYHGGVVAQWLGATLLANSTNPGLSVVGTFVTGGAPIARQISSGNKVNIKNVLEFDSGRHHWNTGAFFSRAEEDRSLQPNPLGYIQFNSVQDYAMSAITGAQIGTAFIMRGNGNVQYTSDSGAAFIQGDLLHRENTIIRGGLRIDRQTRGELSLAPRFSTSAAVFHRVILRAGTGLFVQGWSNDIFLHVIENDGNHLHQLLIQNVALSNTIDHSGVLQSEIISKITPDLKPVRQWISKLSFEIPNKIFTPGLEYTWTDASKLLGSERRPIATGWTDLLESNRSLRKHQVHLRTQYNFKRQAITAHYKWTRSFDNTDGPFSFAAIPGDLRSEWARSAGVSPHNLTIVGNFQTPGDVLINVVSSWRGSAPLNITTGLDPTHSDLFNDRGGLPRNSGSGLPYQDVSLYCFRRFRVGAVPKPSKRTFYLNLGLQAENLLGNRNYISLESTRSSPIFGRPLSALPGQLFRVNVNLSE